MIRLGSIYNTALRSTERVECGLETVRVNETIGANHRITGDVEMKFSKEIITNRGQFSDQIFPSFMTIDDVAFNLKVSKRHVQSLVRRKIIPVIRLGKRCTRFDLARVQMAIKRYEIIEMGRK